MASDITVTDNSDTGNQTLGRCLTGHALRSAARATLHGPEQYKPWPVLNQFGITGSNWKELNGFLVLESLFCYYWF